MRRTFATCSPCCSRQRVRTSWRRAAAARPRTWWRIADSTLFSATSGSPTFPATSGFRDLREFATALEKRGQLRRIATPVSRELEITEITDRVSKGPAERNVALLFEHVEGFDIPVLVNAFGSRERIAYALGVERLD